MAATCTAHAHGAEGIKAAIRAGRALDRACLPDRRRGHRAGQGEGRLAGHGHLQRRLHRGGRHARTAGRPSICARTARRPTRSAQGFRKAVKAGVKIAFGTDAGVYPHGLNARQFAYMVRYGMTPMQAIQSATIRRRRADRLAGQGRRGRAGPLRRHGRGEGRSADRRPGAGACRGGDEGRRWCAAIVDILELDVPDIQNAHFQFRRDWLRV